MVLAWKLVFSMKTVLFLGSYHVYRISMMVISPLNPWWFIPLFTTDLTIGYGPKFVTLLTKPARFFFCHLVSDDYQSMFTRTTSEYTGVNAVQIEHNCTSSPIQWCLTDKQTLPFRARCQQILDFSIMIPACASSLCFVCCCRRYSGANLYTHIQLGYLSGLPVLSGEPCPFIKIAQVCTSPIYLTTPQLYLGIPLTREAPYGIEVSEPT